MRNLVFLLAAFLFMEFVAWFSHKYIMHGFLWSLHKDHHIKTNQNDSLFEKNDLFFLIYAIPAMILIIAGFINSYTYLTTNSPPVCSNFTAVLTDDWKWSLNGIECYDPDNQDLLSYQYGYLDSKNDPV